MERLFRYVGIVIFGVTIFLWQYFAAPIHDDFCYMRVVPDTAYDDFWNGYGAPVADWGDALESAANHYWIVNGRLSNIIMILTVRLPDIVNALLLGICGSMMLWIFSKCAGQLARRRPEAWLVILSGVAMFAWLPFRDHMMSRDYLINYLVPSLFALAYSMMFLKLRNGGRGSGADGITGACIACGFVTGWLHEGFAVPCLAASLLILIFGRKNRMAILWPVISLLVGASINLLTPATFNKIMADGVEKGMSLNPMNLIGELGDLKIQLCVTVVAAFLLLLSKDARRHFFSMELGYWILVFVSGVIMVFPLNGRGRMLFFPALSLLVMTVGFIQTALQDRPEKPVRGALDISCSLILIAFCVGLATQTYRMGQNQRGLIATLKNNADGIACYDLIPQRDVPWWTLGMVTQYYPFVSELGLHTNGYHFDRMPLILPEKLCGKSFMEWDSLPGSNSFRGGNGIWYSSRRLQPGQRFLVKFGPKTPNALPFKSYPRQAEVVPDAESMTLTAEGDTLWNYNLYLPSTSLILSFDSIP